MEKISLAPNIGNMINSLKSTGYTLESAIADIIDNSIDAQATKVDIIINDNNISILDNGIGMNKDSLIDGVKLGTNSNKDLKDLGKFGMGLTTASISQANNIKVQSCFDSTIFGIEYDVNECIRNDDWYGGKLTHDYITSQGTIVIWENITRFTNNEESITDFLSKIVSHLEKTFYAFLEDNLEITINGENLIATSPFYESFNTRVLNEKEFLWKQPVTIEGFNLLECTSNLRPNERLLSEQGIYIFRNNRFIKHISWAGIADPHQQYNYLRIKINIPASLDEHFELDFKKANIELPPSVIKQIRKFIFTFKAKANVKNTRKVKKQLPGDNKLVEPIWANNKKEKFFYLNPKNSTIRTFMSKHEISEYDMQILSKIILTNVDLYSLQSKNSAMNEEQIYESIKEEVEYDMNLGYTIDEIKIDLYNNELYAPHSNIIETICLEFK